MNDPILDLLWEKLEQNWDDASAHERFLNHCAETQQLPVAAMRYRSMQDRETQPYLQRVTGLALTQLAASRTPRRVVLRNAASLVAVALFLSLSIALMVTALR